MLVWAPHQARRPDLIDALLAPNYVNLAMGDADLAAFKAMAPAMMSMMKEARVDDLELVAEGDAVFARFNQSITLHDGSTTTHRALAYYRLADDKIVVNDVMFVPDLNDYINCRVRGGGR